MYTFLNQFAQSTSSSDAAGAVVGLFMMVLFLIMMAAGIGFLVIWIITLIHVIQHEDVPDRTVWIVVHLLVGTIIGPIYWFMVKKPYELKHSQPKHAAK